MKDLAHQVSSNLHIVPSTLDLMYVALGQSEVRLKPCEERFEKFIQKCRRVYDLILIDCHPAGSILTKTSLQNSDHVVIPVVPQSFAIRGIGLMLEFIKSKRLGASGPTPHILFNRIPRSGERPKEENDIRTNPRFQDKCMAAVLKNYKIYAEPVGGQGFAWSSGNPYSTEAFSNLILVADELAQRTGMNK